VNWVISCVRLRVKPKFFNLKNNVHVAGNSLTLLFKLYILKKKRTDKVFFLKKKQIKFSKNKVKKNYETQFSISMILKDKLKKKSIKKKPSNKQLELT